MSFLKSNLLLWSSLIVVPLCFSACGGQVGAGDDEGSSEAALTAPVCPGPHTVGGIDVSAYQGEINWGHVASAGRKFGIARVSVGIHTLDGYFHQNWANMKAAGLVRGAYQFFYANESAEAQAQLVVSRVGKLGNGDLPVLLDLEDESRQGQSAATIVSKVKTWMRIVTNGTGKKPMIYTGSYFFHEYVHTGAFHSYQLDVPWYGAECPELPYAWHSWLMHQTSDTGRVNGVNGNVDLDLFNGTEQDLKDYANSDGGKAADEAAGVNLLEQSDDDEGSNLTASR